MVYTDATMLNERHIPTAAAAAARLLLGTLLFLVLASYLALPCMSRGDSQLQSVGAPNSCSEHQIFKPQADLSNLFRSLMPEMGFRLPIALTAFVLPSIIALMLRPLAHEKLRRGRRRAPSRLPFATADPPKIPLFAALRDA